MRPGLVTPRITHNLLNPLVQGSRDEASRVPPLRSNWLNKWSEEAPEKLWSSQAGTLSIINSQGARGQ